MDKPNNFNFRPPYCEKYDNRPMAIRWFGHHIEVDLAAASLQMDSIQSADELAR